MAAGAGLLLLAVTVTAMHFLVVVGFMPLARRLSARLSGSTRWRANDGSGSSPNWPPTLRANRWARQRVKRASC